MRRTLLALCLILAMPFAVSAQNSLCQIDLSGVTALLTQAQAAAARGEPDRALVLIAQADEALNRIESRCNLPTVTAEVELGEAFASEDGSFSIQYPADWSLTETASSIIIGTDDTAVETLQTASPSMNPEQQGALIVFGSPNVVAGNQPVDASLEGMIRHFQSTLATFYLVRGSPQYFMLDGRLAAQFEFMGDGFDGLMIIVELEPGTQYAVIAGAAAKGELEAFRPTIVSIAASASQEG